MRDPRRQARRAGLAGRAVAVAVTLMTSGCGLTSGLLGELDVLPEPCRLVSAGTVASVVGPSLAQPGGDPNESNYAPHASCVWRFGAVDRHVRSNPHTTVARKLRVEVSLADVPGSACDDIRARAGSGPISRPVGSLGEDAYVTDLRPQGSRLGFCKDRASVRIEFEDNDTVPVGRRIGRDRPSAVGGAERERVLTTVGREVSRRLLDAPAARIKVREAAPVTNPDRSRVPDPCTLVPPGVLRRLVATRETGGETVREGAGHPSVESACHWSSPPGRTPPLVEDAGVLADGAGQGAAALDVRAIAFPAADGHSSTAWARVHALQWARSWDARPAPGMGAPVRRASQAVVAADSDTRSQRIVFVVDDLLVVVTYTIDHQGLSAQATDALTSHGAWGASAAVADQLGS